mmetsp:Transcript_13173/g.33834  ORF Transcript_13173/g.33834 Transcript_13173/m.33834 type:complete len:279 (+) Transcript_13173:228-1064(+)
MAATLARLAGAPPGFPTAAASPRAPPAVPRLPRSLQPCAAPQRAAWPHARSSLKVALPSATSGDEAAGAASSTEEARWEERFQELLAYKAEWGHCNVVLGSPLVRWVYKLRDLKAEGKVPQERVAKLDSVGFEWQHPFDTAGGNWQEMLSALAAFQAEHGHCDVKKKYDKDPALGYWVNEQRIAKREGRLGVEQQAALEAIGMEWSAKKQCGSKFMVGFRQLVDYRDEHGTLDIPVDDPRWAELRAWVQAQRGAHKKGILSEKRVAYLEGVGFDWGEE